MKLSELKPPTGSRRKGKRVGRGPGSGHGKTSCRGHKGQGSRSGGGVPLWFEGGQMPLQRRLPKRGFHSRNRVVNQIVKLEQLRVYASGDVVDPESLLAKGLLKRLDHPIKILAGGEVKVPLTLKVPAISVSARDKVIAAGGSVEII